MTGGRWQSRPHAAPPGIPALSVTLEVLHPEVVSCFTVQTQAGFVTCLAHGDSSQSDIIRNLNGDCPWALASQTLFPSVPYKAAGAWGARPRLGGLVQGRGARPRLGKLGPGPQHGQSLSYLRAIRVFSLFLATEFGAVCYNDRQLSLTCHFYSTSVGRRKPHSPSQVHGRGVWGGG